jgi:hypothetical protein
MAGLCLSDRITFITTDDQVNRGHCLPRITRQSINAREHLRPLICAPRGGRACASLGVLQDKGDTAAAAGWVEPLARQDEGMALRAVGFGVRHDGGTPTTKTRIIIRLRHLNRTGVRR